jgi:hypothetical protein
MLIGIIKVWVNLVEEVEKFRVHLLEKVPVKDKPVLKELLNPMDLSKKVAVEVMVLPENIQPVVLEKLTDPLPSPTCMVVPVVDPDNGWAQVQEEVQFHWKHMVMVT